VGVLAIPTYLDFATANDSLHSVFDVGALVPLFRVTAFGRGYVDMTLCFALFCVAGWIALWLDRSDRKNRSIAELLVLDGRPSLRTPDGWRDLQQGEVVAFLRGEHGAHQLVNHTENTVRFLAFSTSGEPDIVIRPDSGTLGAYERLPQGSGLRAVFRMGDTVDYYDGEQPPASG